MKQHEFIAELEKLDTLTLAVYISHHVDRNSRKPLLDALKKVDGQQHLSTSEIRVLGKTPVRKPTINKHVVAGIVHNMYPHLVKVDNMIKDEK